MRNLKMFTKEQQHILARAGVMISNLTEEEVFKIANREIEVEQLNDEKLIEFIQIANATYRGGVQIISDADYDFIYIPELRRRNPKHPFLQAVEPEAAFIGKTIKLPVQMLSTDKAKTRTEIEKWLENIRKSAKDIGIDPVTLKIKVTPKLDGFAAYDDGERLYTRGDGIRGTDVSRVFERGLKVGGDGKRGHGAGEIVVNKSYFAANLSEYFENTRNFQAAILAEKKADERVQQAIDLKAALFQPFSQLPSWTGTMQELLSDFDKIIASVWSYVDYDVDGVIIEITNETLKQYMGATQNHYRWQVAFKANVGNAQVTILRVVPHTSRSGRVNPVAYFPPTRLGGVTIQRATAHHYKMVKENGIGAGAVIELVRSGMVIPKIEKVIAPSEPEIPDLCPSCRTKLVWDKDYLYCPNTAQCVAQIENTIIHFFKTLGNIDGFGPKTVKQLYSKGLNSVNNIYRLNVEEFIELGFGEKTTQNLFQELRRSRTEPLSDWRFLAAFGVFRMGTGNCQKLLQHYHLLEVFKLTEEDIDNIEGFDKSLSKVVIDGLHKIENDFFRLYNLGFNLQATPLLSELRESGAISQISGKQIVFTGTMEHGTREEMEVEARKLGAKVGKAVSKKTDFLVAGTNVGMTKINDAKEKGITVLNEREYLSLIQKAK